MKLAILLGLLLSCGITDVDVCEGVSYDDRAAIINKRCFYNEYTHCLKYTSRPPVECDRVASFLCPVCYELEDGLEKNVLK